MKFTFAPETTPLTGYTIKRAIDRGGFGEVYYALSDSGKEVALKLLQRNQQVELRGVTQCLNLKHPNLVSIFDIKTDDEGDHWVIMEYVAGKSLEQVLDEYPRGMPPAEVEQWISGIASGIGFLHDRGIVHRDLKPANVFRENSVVKIGDVGLSKFITPSRRSAQTESVGTVYYMAPEVARGKYGSELDVYSLGVMLYEMLTGHVPFSGESTGEILMKHLTEPPDLSQVAASFRPVIARALEKDPQKRTAGAAQLAAEYRAALQGKPIPSDIPASHFVDVQQLERRPVQIPGAAQNGTGPARYAINGKGGNAHTASYSPGQPEAPRGSAQRPAAPRTGWQRFSDDVRTNPWLAISLGIALLVMFPGLSHSVPFGGGRAWFLWAMPAAFAYLTYWFVTQYLQPGTRNWWGCGPCGPRGKAAERYPVPPTVPPAPVPPTPVAAAPVVPPVAPPPRPPEVHQIKLPGKPARTQPVSYTPRTLRLIPTRSRLIDLSTSMSLAVMWSFLATALIGALSGSFPILGNGGVTLADPARATMFVLSTLLGSWGVLLTSKFWEGSEAEDSRRRISQTAVGAAIGAVSWWLGEALFVPLKFESVFPGIFHQVGSFPLVTPDHTPTLVGSVLYFATLFGLRRWWWQADAFRPKKFRVSSLVVTALVAYVIPAAFAYPQGWGVCVAAAVSMVTQLSAMWIPNRDRAALVQIQSPQPGPQV